MDTSILTIVGDICLVTIPAALVAGGIYKTMQAFIRRDQELKLIEIRATSNKDIKLLRLQAYERMILFLERIDPAATISRVIDPDMLNHEFQVAMMRNIRSEFDHNLSQQLYISSDAWNLIVSAKDEMIKLVGLIGSKVPAEATAQQVSRVILEGIANSGHQLPNKTALEFLKEEARQMF
jgi:hypothetical protein